MHSLIWGQKSQSVKEEEFVDKIRLLGLISIRAFIVFVDDPFDDTGR